MHVIVCVDDRMGMLFNNRRQSRDSILNEYLLNKTNGNTLYMNSYSYKLFKDFNASNIEVSEDFLNQANIGDYCFVEDKELSFYNDQIETLILCKWNRAYPGDFYLDLDLNDWFKVQTTFINGSSHDNIEIEVYIHANKQTI